MVRFQQQAGFVANSVVALWNQSSSGDEFTVLTTSKKEKKAPKFLKELRANGGFVGKACESVGISKPAAYKWRGTDPEFAAQWDAVIELATEDLEKEARRRAYEGIEEPVFYQGEVCGHVYAKSSQARCLSRQC